MTPPSRHVRTIADSLPTRPAEPVVPLGPLAKLLAARPRQVHEFEASGIFGLRGEIPKIGIRVPVKSEQDAALREAHRAIQAFAADVEAAKSDDDIARDKKLCHILHKACVEPTPKDSGGGITYHDALFPDPDWMEKHLKTDEIATLVNLLNLARARESAEPEQVDDATLDRFAEMAVAAGGSEQVAELLVACGREFIAGLLLLGLVRLHEARVALSEVTPTDPPPAGHEPPGTTT